MNCHVEEAIASRCIKMVPLGEPKRTLSVWYYLLVNLVQGVVCMIVVLEL